MAAKLARNLSSPEMEVKEKKVHKNNAENYISFTSLWIYLRPGKIYQTDKDAKQKETKQEIQYDITTQTKLFTERKLNESFVCEILKKRKMDGRKHNQVKEGIKWQEI